MKRATGFKKLNCKICGEEVPKVDEKADKVTCWECVQKSLRGVICTDDREPINEPENEN
jgi:formylmethanofuran dehydrogenase subunit E